MKCKIISEIASNWEGNMDKAKKLIMESNVAGADGVKFQMWRASDLYTTDHPEWNNIIKSELSFEQTTELKQYADEVGIDFFCSAFYPDAVTHLESLNVKQYKVASRTCLFEDPWSLETLQSKADTKKKIIISMGMGGEKNRINEIFNDNETLYCYCISEYPTNFNKINWDDAKKFTGFSDHTLGINAAVIFACLKKEQNDEEAYIEKHVKLKDSIGPDASTSIDTDQLKKLVDIIRQIEKI
ncbi:MAG: shikimate dehydrogenase [Chloroflexi bacterium]|nr:shikimate dehydrogenase [Chloroflexota bacterium]|tara:strand:+ start:8543 stop:9268 length:726 start_codon:yes stop_codon:yes gene_type:complete